MVKLTGGYIGNDVAPKNIRYIAGGKSPNNKKLRNLTPEELREKQIKKKLRELQRKKKKEEKLQAAKGKEHQKCNPPKKRGTTNPQKTKQVFIQSFKKDFS